jgi:hypothetical protein
MNVRTSETISAWTTPRLKMKNDAQKQKIAPKGDLSADAAIA